MISKYSFPWILRIALFLFLTCTLSTASHLFSVFISTWKNISAFLCLPSTLTLYVPASISSPHRNAPVVLFNTAISSWNFFGSNLDRVIIKELPCVKDILLWLYYLIFKIVWLTPRLNAFVLTGSFVETS